jgi:hypothetical protein
VNLAGGIDNLRCDLVGFHDSDFLAQSRGARRERQKKIFMIVILARNILDFYHENLTGPNGFRFLCALCIANSKNSSFLAKFSLSALSAPLRDSLVVGNLVAALPR